MYFQNLIQVIYVKQIRLKNFKDDDRKKEKEGFLSKKENFFAAVCGKRVPEIKMKILWFFGIWKEEGKVKL